MTTLKDLTKRLESNEITKTAYFDNIIDNELVELYKDVYNKYHDLDMYSIEIRMIERGYIAKLNLCDIDVLNIFTIVWQDNNVNVVEVLLNKYPHLFDVDNTCATYINFDVVHTPEKNKMILILMIHCRHPRTAQFICENFHEYIDLEPYYNYITTQHVYRMTILKLMRKIQHVHNKELLDSMPYNAMKPAYHILPENIGYYLYNNRHIIDNVNKKMINYKTLLCKLFDMTETNANFIWPSVENMIVVFSTAIRTFNVTLITSINYYYYEYYMIFTAFYDNIAKVYLYEIGNIDLEYDSVSPLCILRELRAKETKDQCAKYIIPDIAKLIGEYVPYEIIPHV
jgi:hypothetical protein